MKQTILVAYTDAFAILIIAHSFVFASNLILGLVLSIFFGLATDESSNVNWVDYHGGTWDQGDLQQNRAGWATFISQYIVLFAAVDGLAVYPLCVVSLGEIIMGSIYEEQVHEMEDKWMVRVAFRLLASVPQAIGALFVSNLGNLAKYSSIFTLLSYTVCPSILYIVGRQRMAAESLTVNTHYQNVFSSPCWAWILILLSTALVGAVIAESF